MSPAPSGVGSGPGSWACSPDPDWVTLRTRVHLWNRGHLNGVRCPAGWIGARRPPAASPRLRVVVSLSAGCSLRPARSPDTLALGASGGESPWPFASLQRRAHGVPAGRESSLATPRPRLRSFLAAVGRRRSPPSRTRQHRSQTLFLAVPRARGADVKPITADARSHRARATAIATARAERAMEVAARVAAVDPFAPLPWCLSSIEGNSLAPSPSCSGACGGRRRCGEASHLKRGDQRGFVDVRPAALRLPLVGPRARRDHRRRSSNHRHVAYVAAVARRFVDLRSAGDGGRSVARERAGRAPT